MNTPTPQPRTLPWQYEGTRRADGRVRVSITYGGAMARPLPFRLGWMNHSPNGFEWGYEGSGPAQLALAILGDFVLRVRGQGASIPDARDLTLRHHQDFKRELIARFPRESPWILTADRVELWLDTHAPGWDQ